MTITTDRPVESRHQPVAPRPDKAAGRGTPWSSSLSRTARWARRHFAKESGVVILLCGAAYLTIAILLDFVYRIFPGDAVSRMANAFYILYSRDPHIAAIGFVWNPGQTIGDFVFLVFKDVWPPLATHDMAGSLVCVLCMTGAVHQLRSALQEWGVPRIPRLVLTALFALNPMILFYSGNGMSEAMYLFTIVATCRYLSRWFLQDDLRSLVYAATALGLAYLDRNEAVGSAVLSGSLVLITTFMRTDGPRRTRVMAAFSDTTILLIPVITTFVGWAFTSYVITGQPFQQYSSQYGTSAQARVSGGTPVGLSASLMTDFHFVESMAPLLPLVLVAVLVVAWRRRDALVLVPLATVGGALGVDLAGYVVGAIAGTYRYFIVTIPLGVLLVGILLSAPSARAARTTVNGAFNTPGRRVKAPRDSPPSRLRQRLSVAAMTIVAIVAVAPALPATAKEMFSSTNGGDSSGLLSFVFDRQLTASDLTVKNHYSAVLRTDQYIEGLNLPDGDILVDNFSGCIPDILTTISNPKLFVIPNDRDFRQVLADPLTFHVHYMLDPPPTGDGKLVSLNIAYPTLYATGDRFTKLVHQFPATNLCIGDDRLFHVIGHPNVG